MLPLVMTAMLALPADVDAGISVFGDACLKNAPASREGLASLAAQRRWVAGHAPTPENLEWRAVYRAGDAIVRLDQHRASDQSPGERICVVLVGPAPAGWSEQVSTLVSNGAPVGAPGAYDTEVYDLPPGLELTVWDLPDGSRIHALREPDNTLELSVNYPTGR